MLPAKIKKSVQAMRKPRLPLDAVLKLHGLPVTTRKGEKGYDRKRLKKQTKRRIEEDIY
jgi:hypothetical protein